ncbi:hypothetical protein LCGC14_1446290 [marine sediment metagenome]|uniref:Leucine-rich repeat domain-containing protein n=1 Tax=marine sediment metagenome TaxID=412755 RepID=A0A0F9JJ54_9ZZZZ|nr:leucine-rich repeat domain-containing protein [bacterium]
MAKITAELMEGDEESDLEAFFVKASGVDLRAFHQDRRVLTREIFEARFDKIMEVVEKRASRRTTFLVLGYFILLTGSFLPEDLRFKIIEATKWEHERDSWDTRFVRKRKFYLRDLREKIRAHRPGVKLHLVHLKNGNDEDFTNGIIGLDQFWDCVESGNVFSKKHINLDSCGLTSIPKPIFKLDFLESLSLDYNDIRNVPQSIDKLTSLKRLYLNSNFLKILPETIGNLLNLEILFLEENQLENLPNSFKNLKYLKIFLRNNLMTKLSPNFENLI